MRFFIIFVGIYLMISLPDMLGFTFTVQWVQGVSEAQMAWTYFITGLYEKAAFKGSVSGIVCVLCGIFKKKDGKY